MPPLIKLLRPRQWVKNGFVVLPIVFAHELTSASKLIAVGWMVVAFCLLSSAIYAFNDVLDRDADRDHPRKRLRPVASGEVSVVAALMLAAALAAAAFAITVLTTPGAWPWLLAYIVTNIAYGLKLKQVSLIDVALIGTGFVYRVVAGGVAADVWISPWMIVMTFLLSLLLGFAKRRDDLLNVPDQERHRASLKGYTPEFLAQAMTMMAGIVIVSYLMYCFSPTVIERHNTQSLYLTAIFVVVGVLRYLQRSLVFNQAASPTNVLLTDRVLQTVIAAWLVSIYWVTAP